MQKPIKVTSRFATPYDTARVLGVSKRRTEELIRSVRKLTDRILQREALTSKAAKRKAVVSSAEKKRGRKAVTKA